MAKCDVDKCERPARAHKKCRPHYMRHFRTGQVRPDVEIGTRCPYLRPPGRLCVEDVAQLLGVSDTTVRRLADTGRLPMTRDARDRRWFDSTVVQRIAAASVEESTVPPPVPERRRAVKAQPVRRMFDAIDTEEL